MSLFQRLTKKVVTQKDVARQYQQHPSLSDHLPWLEWSEEHGVMLLEDGRSVGAVYDIKAVPTEARPEAKIAELHQKIVRLLATVLPFEDDNPWVMQIFVQDDLTLMPIYESLKQYMAKFTDIDNDQLAIKYLSIMQDHFRLMRQPNGMLTDPLSGLAFRGKIRRIRVAIYRRYTVMKKKQPPPDALAEIASVCQTFEIQMQQVGIRMHRMKGRHLYDWLVRWFNPAPHIDRDTDALLKRHPYSVDSQPFGWSFNQNVFFGSVESYDQGWAFDGIKHTVMAIKELDQTVEIGAISREKEVGDEQKYALLDKFPPGAIYTMHMAFESKAAVNEHLNGIESAAIGKSSVVQDIHRNVSTARYQMDKGTMLLRCVEAIYLRAETEQALAQQVSGIAALLGEAGLSVLPPKGELFPKDLYLRFLPFNFSYMFDKKDNYRASYKYAHDIARLLPLYGRSQGDGVNPLHLYYNRGGEVFMFDHLSRNFKMSNSHMAIIGTTGAGKSVVLNNLCMSLSAVRNPRIIAMEVGGSFDLTAKYLAEYGRQVKVMKFDRLNPIPVNPYAEAYQALAIIEAEEEAIAAYEKATQALASDEAISEQVMTTHQSKLTKEINTLQQVATEEELKCEEDRDILNEMVIATRVMITQGKAQEEAKIDPTDLALITQALIHAMKRSKARGVPQMLLSHVIESMAILGEQETNQALQERLKNFSIRLNYYTSGTRGQFINRPSEPLVDFDFLHIDFGFMQSESYKDLLNVACIALLAKVLAMAEANKATGRPTELFLDEAHVLFKSDMVAAFIILMAKVARKIGLWLKPCTQNIEDFTGIESKKVLSMMETWLCLALEADEVRLIEKFKPLSDEIRSLILDVKKYPGIYSEGVLLGKRYTGLFRNVPPRIALSLAMTEQDERTRRRELQRKHKITELEAVELMAKELTSQTHKENNEAHFLY